MQPGEISPGQPGEGSHEWALELKSRPEIQAQSRWLRACYNTRKN